MSPDLNFEVVRLLAWDSARPPLPRSTGLQRLHEFSWPFLRTLRTMGTVDQGEQPPSNGGFYVLEYETLESDKPAAGFG